MNTSLRKVRLLSDVLGQSGLKFNYRLSALSSFGTGGPADGYFEAKTINDLVLAVKSCREKNINFAVIGSGANLLISDQGFRGLVIKNKTADLRLISENKEESVIEGDSGVTVNRLVKFAGDNSLTGLEPFYGQPGTIGGSLWINSHNMRLKAFFGDRLYKAKILMSDGRVVSVDRVYFQFGYDRSSLQKSGEIVLSADFRLKKGDRKTIFERAQKELDYRLASQPYGKGSAGCVFKNLGRRGEISAGRLIEEAGMKGARIGGAEVSLKHGNFIINKEKASSGEIYALIEMIREKVKKKFGRQLTMEIVLLGKF